MTKDSKVKKFWLHPDQIAPVYLGRGGCIATDRIVCDGMKVGYMYREKPHAPLDSGWRFFCGDEDNAYMANDDNHGVYDLNTLVNCDPDIVEFLESAVGSAFERGSMGAIERLR